MPEVRSTSVDTSTATTLILEGLSTVFGALGRAFLCLDENLEVMHAEGLEELAGLDISNEIQSRPITAFLGEELFGDDGTLRRALQAGERREGWGATLRLPGGTTRPVSVTIAPLRHPPGSVCDPRVASLVVLRAAEATDEANSSSPVFFSGMVARAPVMRRLFRLIESLAESDATVLISGESGTGKELVARAIHRHSRQREGNFVAVNCGALPTDLLESELFGHVKGAFTGATRDRGGRFELAQGGTLFLDEVGELPLSLQVKLLRVLQERTFERVGESRQRHTDARIVAATNANLQRAVSEQRFRKDLFYRLRVLPIEIPPLRERREDVEPLARYLLTRVAARHNRALRFAPDALSLLLRYDWPGNVRELENALEYAVALCQGQTIQDRDLPPELMAASPESPAEPAPEPREAESGNGEGERLRATLEAHRWCRQDAARELGISRTTLWRKMREHGLAE